MTLYYFLMSFTKQQLPLFKDKLVFNDATNEYLFDFLHFTDHGVPNEVYSTSNRVERQHGKYITRNVHGSFRIATAKFNEVNMEKTIMKVFS